MNEQSEAHWIIHELEIGRVDRGVEIAAAAELRRLHEENENMQKINDFLRNRRGKSNYPQMLAAAELRRLHEVNEELVEALEEIHEEPFDGNDVCRIARVALAKAKGESNERST